MSPLRSSRYLARSPVRSPGAGLDLVVGAAGAGSAGAGSAAGALPVMGVSSVVAAIVGGGELCEELSSRLLRVVGSRRNFCAGSS